MKTKRLRAQKVTPKKEYLMRIALCCLSFGGAIFLTHIPTAVSHKWLPLPSWANPAVPLKSEPSLKLQNVPAEMPEKTFTPEVTAKQTISVNEKGIRTVESYNEAGTRIEKRLFNTENQPLERWFFDAAQDGQIARYENYSYENGTLKQYRTAVWEYEPAGGFLKTNRIYNSQNELVNSFRECESAEGHKFCEEWYDAQGKLTSQKLWDPINGEFQQHIIVKAMNEKSQRVQWLDEEGKKLREAVVSTSGRKLPFGNIRFGGESHFNNKERRSRRPEVI